MSENNKTISDLLATPIAFHPIYVKLFGSRATALYLQQIVYWSDQDFLKDGFFYKTKAEFEDETTLTRSSQDTAKFVLEKLGVIETMVAKANDKPVTHFRLIRKKLDAILEEFLKTSATPAIPKRRKTVDKLI